MGWSLFVKDVVEPLAVVTAILLIIVSDAFFAVAFNILGI